MLLSATSDLAVSANPVRKSRTLSVSERLRSEILQGRLEPGARLNVASTAQRFEISQGALREALSRLVADGLVHAIDRRGFRVSPVSLEDLCDITATRIEIEGLALQRAIELGDAVWEGEIIASLHVLTSMTPDRVGDLKPTLPAWSVVHERFHRALIAACDSSWLLRFRQVLFEQSERYRSLTVSYPIGDRDVGQEHAALAAATLDRDADRAQQLLAAHFNATKDSLIAAHREGASILKDDAS
jgi:DNA-binding GntR family transcriptional regulator